jgi:hypothetical protein
VHLKYQKHALGQNSLSANLIQLVWYPNPGANPAIDQGKSSYRSGPIPPDSVKQKAVAADMTTSTSVLYEVGRYRQWTFSNGISTVAIKLTAGQYYIDLEEVTGAH